MNKKKIDKKTPGTDGPRGRCHKSGKCQELIGKKSPRQDYLRVKWDLKLKKYNYR